MKANAPINTENPAPHKPPHPTFLSRKQVARIVGVSTETLKRADRKGELHPLKFNARLLRYRVDDIARWICAASVSSEGYEDKVEQATKIVESLAMSIHAVTALDAVALLLDKIQLN